jgi:hypothetical protein
MSNGTGMISFKFSGRVLFCQSFPIVIGTSLLSLTKKVGLFVTNPPMKYRQADFMVRAFHYYPSRKK